MRARHSDPLTAIALIALCSATVWAVEPPTLKTEKVAAIATDSPVTPTPADVAREVVKLQEELGGSITKDFGAVPPWVPAQPYPPQQPPQVWRPLPKSPVVALREVAWQLEQSAHMLESLDLYNQADALRDTADRLRKDARRMKAEHNPGLTGQSDVSSRQD